jgi:hypothetical protein
MYVTDDDMNVIIKKANDDYTNSKGTLRFGQSLWNAASDYFKDKKSVEDNNELEAIRGTNDDPFYNDAHIQAFLNKLQNI